MAYSTTTPPVRVAGALAGPSIWYYTSDDAKTLVDDSGYFTNGHDLGMRVGDIVYLIEADNSFILVMASVTVSTAGGASSVVDI